MLLRSGHGDAENADGAGLDGQAPDLALHRPEIDQATRMLMVQPGVSAGEAFAGLRAYAYSRDRRLADVAGDIVARRLRLHRDPGPGRTAARDLPACTSHGSRSATASFLPSARG
jgi:ANTAR domain